MTAAEERRLAGQVDPARHWPVVVNRHHAMPLETWKPKLREETAAAVTRYLTEHGGLPEDVARRAGESAADDQLRGGYATRVHLTAEQLAFYGAEAAR